MKNTLFPWYVKLVIGISFALFACASVAIDLVNSYLYGLMTAPAMGYLAMLIALGIVFLAFAREMGAPRYLAILQVACMVATMYCAWQYYVVSAKKNDMVASNVHEVYKTADEQKKLALETLKRIKEHGDVEDLGKLAVIADANLADAVTNVTKFCKSKRISDDCLTARSAKTLAEDAATTAHTKLSESKEWHAAKATLAEMSATQKQGDVVTHEVDAYAIVGALIFVQLFASLMGFATRWIMEALADRPKKIKAKPKSSVPPTDGGTQMPANDNVVQIAVARWLEQRTVKTGGAMLQGGEARKSYERFTNTKISAAQFKAALLTLLDADTLQVKNSGYTIKGLSLKALATPKQKPAKKSAVG
jgi:hypothetical protein